MIREGGCRQSKRDEQGKKRLQAAETDCLLKPLVAPLRPLAMESLKSFHGSELLSFKDLLSGLQRRMEEGWEASRICYMSTNHWGSVDTSSRPLIEVLLSMPETTVSEDFNSALGEFESPRLLVDAACLLSQMKVACGFKPDAACHAFALFVLQMLGPRLRAEVAAALAKEESSWSPLLAAAGQAWSSLPADQSIVFRAVRLDGSSMAAWKQQLDCFAVNQPVIWTGLSFVTSHRHVALAALEHWDGAGIIFKIYSLTARRMHEYSWIAHEEVNASLGTALIAPGTHFESRGLYQLSDANLRHLVQPDAELRGAEFQLKETLQPLPLEWYRLSDLQRILVILEEVPTQQQGM